MLKSMLPWRDSFAQVSCTSRSRGSRKADRPPSSSVCSGSHWGERPPGDAGGEGLGGRGGSKAYPLRTGRRQSAFILNHVNIFPDQKITSETVSRQKVSF